MAVSLVTILVVGSVVGGTICLALAFVSWRHRSVPAALPFGALMLAVAAWAFSEAAFMLADGVVTAYLASRVVRTAAAQVPPLWVVFILAFAGYERWIDWRTIAALWTVPTVYVFAIVTAPLTGLASTPETVVFVSQRGIRAPVVGKGLAFDLHLFYGLIVLSLGYAVLGGFLLRSRAVYRKQTVLVVLGSLAPVLVYGGLQFGLTPHPGLDATPLAFVVAGVIFGWSLVRYDFLTVTPMAGDVLVNELPDPVFVLDEDDRIVDLNPAAIDAFGLSNPRSRPIDDVAPALPATVADGTQVTVRKDGRTGDAGESHFACSVTQLEDQYGQERTRLVVLRDVTGQRRRQQRLEALQDATRQFLAASTDEEIAEIGVKYADEVLDADGTAVFLDDEELGLVPVATSDAVADVFERAEPPTEPVASVLSTAHEEDELVSQELQGVVGTPERAMVLPLGDHGVLWIGTTASGGLADDDEGFATILARTTQVALTRVERESDLRQSRSSVERRSEQIAFFNGVLRHTLRNALLVIQGRADHLRESVPAEERDHLDVVVDWCDDLAALSEEIKALNDTVTATESERLDAVDLSHLLVRTVREFDADHASVTFEMDVDPGLRVQANDLAGRVVESVLENAVIHNDREDPHVSVWTVRAADRIQVHVADDGPGMDDELKSTVFERDLSTSQTATGFGLYFVSVLMNLYGGTVYFEDNNPRGTVAVLEFQVAEDGDDDGVTDASVDDVDVETD